MSDVSSIVVLGALIVSVVLAIRFRHLLLLSLPVLVALNGVPLRLGGTSLRVDQLAACLLVIPLLLGRLTGRGKLRMDRTAWLLVALLFSNVIASVAHSPVRGYSVQQCVNLASAWVIYIVLITELDTPLVLERFRVVVLWSALLSAALGSVAFVLAVSGLPLGGAEVDTSAAENLTNAYGAYGTMLEPNIFGSFAGAYLLFALGLLLTPRMEGESPRMLVKAVAVSCGVALLVSFTRAAWLGALVGGMVLVLMGQRSFHLRVRWRVVVAGLASVSVVGLALYVAPGETGAFFRYKIANLVNPASHNGIVRIVSWSMALDQTAQHWMLGNGTFSFAALASQGADFQQFDNWRNLWIGNYVLLALHDTGLVGLGLLLAVLVSVWVDARRAMRRVDGSEISGGVIVGLMAAFACLLVAFLSTSGFSLGYSWLLLGYLAASARAGGPKPSPVGTSTVEADVP